MRFGKIQKNERILIGPYNFEVNKYKYVGVMVSNAGGRNAEIEERRIDHTTLI